MFLLVAPQKEPNHKIRSDPIFRISYYGACRRAFTAVVNATSSCKSILHANKDGMGAFFGRTVVEESVKHPPFYLRRLTTPRASPRKEYRESRQIANKRQPARPGARLGKSYVL